jgi:hypothetical protein
MITLRRFRQIPSGLGLPTKVAAAGLACPPGKTRSNPVRGGVRSSATRRECCDALGQPPQIATACSDQEVDPRLSPV